MTTASPSDGRTIGAVERAFEIIGFLRESGPATVSTVSGKLDYSSSTAHIHLETLKRVGYVVQEGDEYATRLYHVAKPEVDRIAEETGEGIGLGIDENGQHVTLYNSRGSDSVHDNALVGEFTTMHWTALGNALLAHRDRSDVSAIVDRYGLPEATEHTITDRERLFEELERTRKRGYAIENEERRDDRRRDLRHGTGQSHDRRAHRRRVRRRPPRVGQRHSGQIPVRMKTAARDVGAPVTAVPSPRPTWSDSRSASSSGMPANPFRSDPSRRRGER